MTDDVSKKIQKRKEALQDEFDKLTAAFNQMAENDRKNHEAMRQNEARRLQLQGAFAEIQELEGTEKKEKLVPPENEEKKK